MRSLFQILFFRIIINYYRYDRHYQKIILKGHMKILFGSIKGL